MQYSLRTAPYDSFPVFESPVFILDYCGQKNKGLFSSIKGKGWCHALCAVDSECVKCGIGTYVISKEKSGVGLDKHGSRAILGMSGGWKSQSRWPARCLTAHWHSNSAPFLHMVPPWRHHRSPSEDLSPFFPRGKGKMARFYPILCFRRVWSVAL